MRTAARRSRSADLVFVLACLAPLLAATAFATAPRLLNGTHRTTLSPRGLSPHVPAGSVPLTGPPDASPNHEPAPTVWPPRGQAAYVIGNAQPAASPDEEPAPIASLAKVMTAYLTLKSYPLSGVEDGFAITVTTAQVRAEAQGAAQHQSVVAVRAGEQLTERQLLEALLIPSGDNIAHLLAAQVAGSEGRFVAEMNAEALTLGMAHTVYTDPSGFDPGTVSTAADQLRVFQEAMRFPVFSQIVSMARVTLPVAGTVTNYDPLIDQGFPGKTGSDSAAGGCLAFFTQVAVAGRPLTAVGVVMGQGEGANTSALLAAAGDAAEQLVSSVAGGPASG